jgi:hypothetical protein
MGDMRNVYKSYTENLKRRDGLGDLDVDRRIILKLIFKKQRVRMRNVF